MQGCVPIETAFLASEPPPLVHTLETTDVSPSQATHRPSRGILQEARQSRAIELYELQDYNPKNSRADKLRSCRKVAWFARHRETGQVRLCLSSCKLRWCVLCASARISWITYAVSKWLANRDRPKFATYTLQHSSAELDDQVTWLYRFFRRLRQRSDYTAHVRGGIWFFHIKKSRDDGLWHPHIHSVLDSSYFWREDHSRLWLSVTGNSMVADIRKIDQPGKAANEVARYAACPCDLTKNSADDNVTLYKALHGKRICGTWGTAKGVPMKPPKDEHPELWENIGGRSVVLFLRDSDPNARAILEAFESGTSLAAGVTVTYADFEIDYVLSLNRTIERIQNGQL